MDNKRVICSAPGKVLITGGYMVLDRPNSGLVLTVNARFYTVIDTLYTNCIYPEQFECTSSIIEVFSPQFHRKQQYRFQWKPHFDLTPLSKNHKTNEFTEKTILYTLISIFGLIPLKSFEQTLSKGLSITIVGDNDFYSQRDQLSHRNLPVSVSSLSALPKFLPAAEGTLETMKKTGLGSSACLTTSLVASLVSFFNAVQIPTKTSPADPSALNFVHNLAQFCHCLAQGKIGSGFDVSSATYGSHRYVRFSKQVLEPLLKDSKYIPSVEELLSILKSPTWDNDIKPFSLPKGMQLVLGDVSKGSNTPNMVSKVLKWKSESSEAPSMIKELVARNTQVEDLFFEIHRLSNELPEYLTYLQECAQIHASKWRELKNPVAETFVKLREAFLQVRFYLREIGVKADVDIEPPSQQELTDATMDLPGVLISGVPGAGGYDAVFAIVLKEEVLKTIEDIWMTRSTLPLILKEESKGVCLDTIAELSKL